MKKASQDLSRRRARSSRAEAIRKAAAAREALAARLKELRPASDAAVICRARLAAATEQLLALEISAKRGRQHG